MDTQGARGDGTVVSEGADPIDNSPQELTKFLQTEIERWTKLIRQANIRSE